MTDPLSEVTAALEELRGRLAKVEAATGASDDGGASVSAAPDGASGADGPPSEFWLLDGLARHTGPAFSRDGVTGSVIYGGHVTAPGVGELSWQMGHPAPDVAEADLDRAAQRLAALGHPFRLRLLRRLLLGASTLAELQEPTGQGTSGQVHHHLRELRSAGLVTSRRRNHYEIPPEQVIPLMVVVAAALGRDLGTDDAGGDDAAAE